MNLFNALKAAKQEIVPEIQVIQIIQISFILLNANSVWMATSLLVLNVSKSAIQAIRLLLLQLISKL